VGASGPLTSVVVAGGPKKTAAGWVLHVAQWNTAKLGVDYRLAPLKAVNETFTWQLPENVAPGDTTVTATIWYSKLVSSVAEFLGVPAEEAQPVRISSHQTRIKVGG